MNPPSPLQCPACGSEVSPHEAYCEGCGAELSPTQQPPADTAHEETAPISLSRSVRSADPAAVLPAPRPCRDCGGTIDADGYCQQCGAKAPTERDHYDEAPSPWVGGVCDRGVRHPRNEDAMALAAEPTPGSRAVLVVCDGVSSSEDSDVASLAAARAAREVLLHQHSLGVAVPHSRIEVAASAMQEAVLAANAAVIENTSPASTNGASCTFAAATVMGELISYTNIGDSRIYWLSDHADSVRLSTDDSVAELQVQAGIAREVAETGPQAHAITRWLGHDAPDLNAEVASMEVTSTGWLLVCSDGLWNYASDPAELEDLMVAALLSDSGSEEPVQLADWLVRWACEQGGRDNITVALARFGPLDAFPGRKSR